MSNKAPPRQNGIVERFMRTLKEKHVDYTEYEDFDDAFHQLKHWLEVTHMTERLMQLLDYAICHTGGARVGSAGTTALPSLISGLIPSRKTATRQY